MSLDELSKQAGDVRRRCAIETRICQVAFIDDGCLCFRAERPIRAPAPADRALRAQARRV